MQDMTMQLWEKQNWHPGDRMALFSTVADALDVSSMLYPGSYVDIAPSFVVDDVTYVDVDRRAARFFADTEGVDEIIAEHRGGSGSVTWEFIHADYTSDLGLAEKSVDVLVSLYAGFISEHCTQHLKRGGHLLVNPSHGDAAMASIDPRYELAGVMRTGKGGAYTVSDASLDTYLIPKRGVSVTKQMLQETNRGIGYTKSPFAYLFERVS